MLKQKYKSFLLNGVFKVQVWMVIAALTLVSNVFLSLKIFLIDTSEKTIIHPLNLTSPYTVDGDQVDPSYIGSLAEDFLRARLLYTPKTVATQFDRIAVNFHPSIYGEKKAELAAEASRIIRNEETSVFFPMGTHVKQMTAYVESEVTGYIGKKEVSQKVKIYEVRFKHSGGRIWLLGWTEVIADSTGENYVPVDSETAVLTENGHSEAK